MYPLVLIAICGISFMGALWLVCQTLPEVRSRTTIDVHHGPSLLKTSMVTIKSVLKIVVVWVRSQVNKALFLFSRILHRFTERFLRSMYRRNLQSTDKAQVSALLRSLKDNNSRGVVR